ncbi:hypothetical protein ACRARG_01290 [Pseudooceanicola sp. C21-150M6]|uniref:hypothetical protein n=1 Tax=Pseudooceanicola sp. C21-150M6 TaxID=3434355 RepID=UPI003D7F341D
MIPAISACAILMSGAVALSGATLHRVSSPAAPASPSSPSAPADPGMKPEDQTVTGRFTTATEVKPILTATKQSWVALREYNGQDLLYVTQILSWRCGLLGLRIGVNNAPMQNWPLPACHMGTATPNALTPQDGLPYLNLPLSSVQSIQIELIYDDLTTDTGSFERAAVLMP